jgi:histidyl-tRNA synthetase
MLRAFGSVEVDTSMRALKTQLKSAEKKGAKVTVIVDSQSPDRLKWKDMDQRTQVDVEDHLLASHAEQTRHD